jgi:opacity protein-like surface antigen
MKTICHFLLFAALLICTTAAAQQKSHSYIGLSGGLSIPLGDFSKTDLGDYGNWNNNTGFAKTGFNIGLEGAYYFFRNIGLGGILNYTDHGKLSKGDAQKLGDSYTDAFAVNYTTVTTGKRYKTLNVLIGPCLFLPVRKFTLDVRLVGGLSQSISTPEIAVQLENDESNVFVQKSSTASAFGWQVGMGLRYALSEKMAVAFRGDYFQNNGVKITNENRNNNAGRLVTHQSMRWVNISLGLAYTLGK